MILTFKISSPGKVSTRDRFFSAFPARPGSRVPKLSPAALGSRPWHRWAAGVGGDAANCGHGAEARHVGAVAMFGSMF